MGDDDAESMSNDRSLTSEAPSRTGLPEWAIAPVGCGIALLVIIVVLAIIVIAVVLRPFSTPDVGTAVSRVQAMPCVTWAKATTEGGRGDVRPSAIVQVGLRPSCTAAEINATYASLYNDTASVRDDADFKIEYLVTSKAPEQPVDRYAPTKSTVAELSRDSPYNLPGPKAFARTVDDWLTVRHLVDPGAQLEVQDRDSVSPADERYIANSTADQLRVLSSSLPEQLREQAWKLTIPANGDVAFVPENTAPAGGVTLESSSGFPDPWLVDFGVQLNGAWPDGGKPEYAYVFRDPPNSGGYFNELSARVFNVARPKAASGRLTLAQQTTAWPALTAAVDAMASTPGSQDGNFAIGFALYSRPYMTGEEHRADGLNTITLDSSLAVVSPSLCAQPLRTEPDGGAIAASLCDYNSQRATTADGGDGGN